MANTKRKKSSRAVPLTQIFSVIKGVATRVEQLTERVDKLATRDELYDLRAEMLVKIDRLDRRFDVVAENIHKDVAGANKDEILGLKDARQDHEKRITKLEEKIGVR